MNQLELFSPGGGHHAEPPYLDIRVYNLRNFIKVADNGFWSPCTVDKIEKTGRMFNVLSETVVKCFEEAYASSNDSKNQKH